MYNIIIDKAKILKTHSLIGIYKFEIFFWFSISGGNKQYEWNSNWIFKLDKTTFGYGIQDCVWTCNKIKRGMPFSEKVFFSCWHQWRHLILLPSCGLHLPGQLESPSPITGELSLSKHYSSFLIHLSESS